MKCFTPRVTLAVKLTNTMYHLVQMMEICWAVSVQDLKQARSEAVFSSAVINCLMGSCGVRTGFAFSAQRAKNMENAIVPCFLNTAHTHFYSLLLLFARMWYPFSGVFYVKKKYK